jgi:antitoxin component HigA of HigAB toxin-antitoxin module
MRVTASKTAVDSYMKLIREFPLRRIRTARDHRKATRLVLRLSSHRGDRGTADYLDVLIELIAEYERSAGEVFDTSSLTAAELVRHRIEERRTTISALARRIDVSQSNLSEMLNNRRDWSKAAIRGLVRELNIRAERFLV